MSLSHVRNLMLASVAAVASSQSQTPETFMYTLGGTTAVGGNELSFGNVLPETIMPWGFSGWAPVTNLNAGSWWFTAEESTLCA
jgi:putative alpha-1,2-mannosidase